MDARAVELFRRGLTYTQIGETIGRSSGTAREAVKRGLLETGRDPFTQAEAMTLQADRAQDRRRILTRIAHTRHYVVDQGKVVRDADGQPLVDDAPVMRAVDLLRKEDEKEERLLDLLPAAKQRVEFVPNEALMAELARIRDKLPPSVIQAIEARMSAAGMLPAGEGAAYAYAEEVRRGPGDSGAAG